MMVYQKAVDVGVSTHSRLKAAGVISDNSGHEERFNTQPPEGGCLQFFFVRLRQTVSTHSRLKAAGLYMPAMYAYRSSFNTQPPEGGWVRPKPYLWTFSRFNTQPPEGGWI